MTSPDRPYQELLENKLGAKVIVERAPLEAARLIGFGKIDAVIVPLFFYSMADRNTKNEIDQFLGSTYVPVFEAYRYEPKELNGRGLEDITKEVLAELKKWFETNLRRAA